MMSPSPDHIVADKYRLTRLLGQGGMGAVWEGEHTTLGTRVAVKFIDKQYADNLEARARFENEARAVAKLSSKHVVKVFDHGVTEEGHPYIVMEFLEGEPLDRRLERQGRLTPAETATILMQICRGLANAHQAGIVHRDLKPENIFLAWDADDRADVAKVVDFGIAKFDQSTGVSSATRTGVLLGTPYYMSPEQARGLKNLDFRSDLWSLGVIAYRCIVGTLPFHGEAMGDLLVKICVDPLPVPSKMAASVPPEFDAWFAKALSREPEARFQSAAALSEALLVACGVSLPASELRPKASSNGSMRSTSSPDLASAGSTPVLGATASDAQAATQAGLSKTRRSLRPRGSWKSTLALGLALGVVITILVLALVNLSDPGSSGHVAGTAAPESAGPAQKALPNEGSSPSKEAEKVPASDEVGAPLQTAEEKESATDTSKEKLTGVSAPARTENTTRAPVAKPRPPQVKPKPVQPRSPEELLGY